jgi:hypothetical protein
MASITTAISDAFLPTVFAILMRQTSVERRYFGPAFEPRTSEIIVDPPHAGLADLRDFLEQSGCDCRRCVIGIDQHGELARDGRIVGHAGIVAAIRLLVIGVPTGRPDNDCSVAEIRPVMLPTSRSGMARASSFPVRRSSEQHLARYGAVAV